MRRIYQCSWRRKRKNKAIDTNVIGTKNIHNICSKIGVKLIYISTDYVYNGINGNFKETDLPEPFNFYGMTKLLGEAYVNEDDLIIRTSFKPSKWKFSCAFDDIFTSAGYIDEIAFMISKLIKKNACGIFNVGTERKSVYNLAIRRNKSIMPISRNTIQDVKMPIDISMNIDKYLDFVFRSI